MSIFRFIIPSGRNKIVVGVDTWRVNWYSRHGKWLYDVEKEAQFFIDKQDAEDFAKSLRDAFSLLKHCSQAKVTVTKTNHRGIK